MLRPFCWPIRVNRRSERSHCPKVTTAVRSAAGRLSGAVGRVLERNLKGDRSMIDVFQEELLTLSQAARALPAIDGKRVHPSTIFRWIVDGVRGVKLEHVRVGRRICTTEAALTKFMNALAEAPKPERPYKPWTPRPRTEQQRARDMAAAEKRLREIGAME